MSLINDALKRAKQSQTPPAASPAPHLHFRPVEPDPAVRHSLGLLLPVGLVLVALLGLFFVWELAHQNSSTNPQPELVARAASATPVPAPAPLAPVVPETTPPEPPPSEPTPAVAAPNSVEAAPAETAAPPAVADDPPAPPKPAPLRLQGIVFNPAHPSAMINGKTVYIGEKVGGFQVSEISQNSATLINAGQTNILELAQ